MFRCKSLFSNHVFLWQVDDTIGRVLAVLQEQQVEQDTIVFFTSDNGPWATMLQAGGSAGQKSEAAHVGNWYNYS